VEIIDFEKFETLEDLNRAIAEVAAPVRSASHFTGKSRYKEEVVPLSGAMRSGF
jgi:hypothetical protein